MNPEDIVNIIESGIEGSQATVTADGNKYEATIISNAFEGLNLVKKHQLVYALLNEHITSGAIHALTIKAYTPAEWEAK
jgi:acid stress-induced BolA-like protein IbaG/YrbA